ncbi:MAG TPA: CAP domain-containing protein [Polaromonas sp.]
MKTRKIPVVMPLATVAALLAFAGCGGGGGGGVASPATLPAAVTTVFPSTHAAGSEELAAFNLLNAERERCGFGSLAQNAQLDAAARAHADYQIVNSVVSHLEDAGNPNGFTGVFAADRIAAAGYTDAGALSDEIAGFLGTSEKAGLGGPALRNLLNAPYHLQGLMSGFRDVGMSVRSSADTGVGAAAVILQINAAYKRVAGPQLFAGTEVHTYPCEGTSGVNFKLTNEEPNPVPGRDLSTAPLGSSVYVAARDGNVLDVTSASMVQLSTGQFVTLRAPITAANDPHGPCVAGCFKSHQAYVVADAPLQANMSYQVTINGTNNGTSFSRTFSFATGTGG